MEKDTKIKSKPDNNELSEPTNKKAKRKLNIGNLISRILVTILFIFVLLETIIGVIDIKDLKDEKEPTWYINTKKEKTKDKEVTTYNLGFYVIVKTQTKYEITVVLRPFFL